MKNKFFLICTYIFCSFFPVLLTAQQEPFLLSNSEVSHIGWPFGDGSTWNNQGGWNVTTGSPYHQSADLYADDYNKGGGNDDLGEPLVASIPGEIIFIENTISNAAMSNCNSAGYGNQVIIRYGDFAVRYAHLYDVAPSVAVGADVQIGDPIGSVGHSGLGGICPDPATECCTAHLHIVLYKNIFAGSSALASLLSGAVPSASCATPFFCDGELHNSLPEDGAILSDEGTVLFNFGIVTPNTEIRLQVVKVFNSTPFWDVSEGFESYNQVVNSNLGLFNSGTASFEWDAYSLTQGYADELPLSGQEYAYTYRTYHPATGVSYYSVPQFFYISSNCSEGLQNGSGNGFVQMPNSCVNLRVDNEAVNATVTPGGQIDFSFENQLLGEEDGEVVCNANVYLSASVDSYDTETDLVASYNSTLSEEVSVTTHSGSILASSEEEIQFLHVVTDPENEVNEYVENDDNNSVFAISVSSSSSACLPAENLAAVNITSTSFDITFDSSPTGSTYSVFIREVGTTSWQVLTPTYLGPGWSAVHSANPGILYEYFVKTVCIDGSTDDTEILQITTPGEGCAFSGLNVEVSSNLAHVFWNPLSPNITYRVELFDASGTELIERYTSNTYTYFSNLTSDTNYSVKVTGLCPSGTLLVTDEIGFSTLPFTCGPISNLTGISTAYNASFTWSDPSDNVGNSYWSWTSTNGTSGNGQSLGTSFSLPVTGPQTITLSVYGTCSGGIVTETETISVDVPEITCGITQNLSLVTSTATSLGFNWTPEDDATHYQYSLTDSNGNIVEETSWHDGTFVLFNGLSPEETYQFEVAPRCSGTLGGFSSISATTQGGTGTDPAVEFTKVFGNTWFGDLAVTDTEIVVLNSNKIVRYTKDDGTLTDSYNFSVAGGDISFEKVISLSDGNLVGVGDIIVNGGSNPCLIKFSPDGTLIWSKELSGGSSYDFGEDIIEDSDGNLVMCGAFTSFGALNKDSYIAKFSPSGSLLWQKAFGAIGHQWMFSIANTNDGGYFISGRGRDPDSNISTGNGLMVFKLSAGGSLVWGNIFLDSDDGCEIIESETDAAGNLFFVGAFNYKSAVGRINTDGSLSFFKTFTSTSSWNKVSDLTVTEDYVYVAGDYRDTNGDQQLGILKLDLSGNLITSKLFAGDGDNYGRGIETDGNNLFISGLTEGFPYDGNNKGLLMKRPLDLSSDCFTIPFNPTVTSVALQQQSYTTLSSSNFTVTSPTVSISPLTFTDFDPCGAPPCPIANASVNETIGCPLDEFIFIFTGTEGEAITWTASDGSTASGDTSVFTFDTPGIYTITCNVSSQDCTDSYLMDVTVTDYPTMSVIVSDPACPGTTGLVEVLTDAGHLVEWQDGNTSRIRTDLSEGTYSVSVTNNQGCTIEEAVVITDTGSLPTGGFTVEATDTNRNYIFSSSALDATLITWDWGDNSIGSGASAQHTYSTSGTFVVVHTATNACGSSSVSQDVIVACPEPSILIEDTNICVAESSTITAEGVAGAIIEWQIIETGLLSDNNSLTVDFQNAGDYTIVLRATIGNCTVSTAVFITVSSPPTISLIGVGPSCSNINDGAIQVSVEGGDAPYIYDWNNASSLAELSAVGSGTYTVTVTDNENCTASNSETLQATLEYPTADFDFTISGATVDFQNISTSASVSWNFGDNNTSNENDPTHTYSSSGSYEVTLSNTNSCGTETTTKTVSVTVDNNGNSSPFSGVIPTNLFGVILGQAQIDGIFASGQDWIAAFDSDGNIAGASQIIQSGGISYINLTVFGDDLSTPADEGIGPEEDFYLRIYDYSEDQYLDYPSPSPVAFTEWQNTNGAPMPAYSDFNQIYNWVSSCEDIVTLGVGWNLISLDVVPEDSTLTVVFSDLMDLGVIEVISSLTPTGSQFWKQGLPAPLNNLTHIEQGKGYWVKTTTATNLNVVGTCIDETYRPALYEGWQMVAYIPQASQTVTDYYEDEIDAEILEYVTSFVNGQGGVFFSPDIPGPLNSLVSFQNGQGYFVKTSIEGFTNESGEDLKSSVFSVLTADLNTFSGNHFSIRDADGNIVAQAHRRDDGWLEPVTLYGDSPITLAKEGIEIGISLFLYNDENEKITTTPFVFNGQPNVFALSAISGKNSEEELQLTASPNPANSNLNIDLNKVLNSASSLVLIDAFGRIVSETILPSGSHSINIPLYGVPNGYYTLLLMRDNNTQPLSRTTIVVIK